MADPQLLASDIAAAKAYMKGEPIPVDTRGQPLMPVWNALGLRTPAQRGTVMAAAVAGALFALEPNFAFKNGGVRPFAALSPDDPEATYAHPGLLIPAAFLITGAFL